MSKRWWHRWFLPRRRLDAGAAPIRWAPSVHGSGNVLPPERLQVVDYTDGGLMISMPIEVADTWDELPADVRAQFMADMDAMAQAKGVGDGWHEWRG